MPLGTVFFWAALAPRAVSPRSPAEQICSLDRAPEGQRAEVLEVAGGRDAQRRLAQLGIAPGAAIVIRRAAPLGGPILVEAQGATVAVGRGLARKVRVRVLP